MVHVDAHLPTGVIFRATFRQESVRSQESQDRVARAVDTERGRAKTGRSGRKCVRVCVCVRCGAQLLSSLSALSGRMDVSNYAVTGSYAVWRRVRYAPPPQTDTEGEARRVLTRSLFSDPMSNAQC